MIWWILTLGVLGIVFGSFIATVAIRWPDGRSALKGRSECDGCGKVLSAAELVPVASYALQRGRCRQCGAAIEAMHLWCELTGLGIGIAAAVAAPGREAVAGAIFGWLLLMLAALDLRAFWLPNLVTGVLALAGVATGVIGFAPAMTDRLIGGVAGFAVLWTVAALYRAARGREGLGGGDAKLMGAIGLWLGWHDLPMVLLVACLVGLGVVAVSSLRGKRMAGTDRLPLGALLAVAAFPIWVIQAIR